VTRLTTVASPEAAAQRAAEVLARLVQGAREERGVAHLGLAGGATPRATYDILGPLLADWSAVALWFGDERCVDAQDPDSNYRMVSESLLSHAGVPEASVHRIPGELGPDAGARAYARTLHEGVKAASRQADQTPRLDVILLGLGEDGHTASLFPGGDAVARVDELCVGVHDAPKPPPERISLSLGVLRAARRCVLLATGQAKADAVAAVLGEPDRHVPASLLRRGTLELIVDDAASPPPPLRGA